MVSCVPPREAMASITAVDTVPTPRNPIFIVDSLAQRMFPTQNRAISADASITGNLVNGGFA